MIVAILELPTIQRLAQRRYLPSPACSKTLAQVDAGEKIVNKRREVAIASTVAEPTRLSSGLDLE
jgi:hypothetical protein